MYDESNFQTNHSNKPSEIKPEIKFMVQIFNTLNINSYDLISIINTSTYNRDEIKCFPINHIYGKYLQLYTQNDELVIKALNPLLYLDRFKDIQKIGETFKFSLENNDIPIVFKHKDDHHFVSIIITLITEKKIKT